MISPSRRQHKATVKPLNLELHRRLARRSYWQQRLLCCGLTALAASLGALLFAASWHLRLLCVLGGFLCGFAWPVKGALARSLGWFDAHVGLSYRTALEHAATPPDPYGFTEAVKERARASTARLDLPPAQPWWLPLLALALGLALLPALHLNLGGGLPSSSFAPQQQPRPSQVTSEGPHPNAPTSPPQAGQPRSPASSSQKGGQGTPEEANGTPQQNSNQDASQAASGDAGSEASALSQFAQQVRQNPAPSESSPGSALSTTPGNQQTNPSSQATTPSSQNPPEGQQSQGQQGQESVGQQQGQSNSQAANGTQPGQSNQQTESSQQSGQHSQSAPHQGQQGGANTPAAGNKLQTPSQQGKSGSSSQQSSESQQSQSRQGQEGGQDQAGRTLSPGQQGNSDIRGAAPQQTPQGTKESQSQQTGSGAGNLSGNGAGKQPGSANKAPTTPLATSGQLTYLPGQVTKGATTDGGKVVLPGTLPNALPSGSAPSGYDRALEQAITEGHIPVEYQQILRNYFQ